MRGALNLYRLGESAAFSEADFELARRFGDAAALALAQAEMRDRLEQEARTDALTGLANRRAFRERLASELERSSRTLEPVGLLMLDIDDFKRVNDRYGHGVGDQALIKLARALEGAVRSVDLVCRLGGEEFALILQGTDAEVACEIARRTRRSPSSRQTETATMRSCSSVLIPSPPCPHLAARHQELVDGRLFLE